LLYEIVIVSDTAKVYRRKKLRGAETPKKTSACLNLRGGMFIKSVKLFAIGTLGSASAKIHPREQIRFAMAR
jgi:hypothetical protein